MDDEELIEFADEFREGVLEKGSPDSMCFAITAPLEGSLEFSGVDGQFVEGTIELPGGSTTNHFWLELGDGGTAGATADQFNAVLRRNMPAVYLGEKPDWYLPV